MFAASSLENSTAFAYIIDVDITHVNLPLVPDFAVPEASARLLISQFNSTWKGEA